MLSTPAIVHRISLLFCLFAGFIPLIAVDIPKSLAFLPAIMGVLFYGLVTFALKIKLGLSKNALFLALIIFGMSVISLIWAKDFDVTLRQALRFSALLPPLVILISLVSRIPREIILPYIRYYPYAIALASLLIILEILWGGILFNLVRGLPLNIAPQIFEYNRAAVLLALCSFGALAILKKTIHHKFSFLILIIPLGTALVFSVCQTAQLMFLVGFTIYFAFPYTSKWAWTGLKIIIMVLMLIAPFTVGFIFHHFAHNLMDVTVVKEASGGARLEIWDYVSRYALQHPFFGYGADVTRTITDFDCAYVFNTINLVNHPHNFVLQIWIEYGLFGILVAMGVIYKGLTLIQTHYSVAQQKILLPSFLAGMVAASTAYGLWQGMWIGAMFFAGAMAILASRIYSKFRY